MYRFSLFLILLVFLSSSGCASVGRYFADRGNDFLDIFGLNVSYGAGVLVNVRATQFAQVGLVAFSGARFGFNGRRCLSWYEESIEIGISPFYYGREVSTASMSSNMPEIHQVMRVYTLLGPIFALFETEESDVTPQSEKGSFAIIFREDGDKSFDEAYDRRLFDIGFSVHCLLVGIEVFVNPAEAIDFVLGLFTIDLSGDDGGRTRGKDEEGNGNKNRGSGGESNKSERETSGDRNGR